MTDRHHASVEGPVAWVRAGSPELDPWRSAVGPPLILRHRDGPTADVDDLAFAVWNTNVGAGDLQGFVADLLAGRLFADGRPTEHAVLLLQEVYRAGGAVPARIPRQARGARRIHGRPRTGARLGIDAVAERFGLDLYYVPSMRNGRPGEDGPAEDRGNAILSTLPLTDWTAFELPFERQRRVAIAARVSASAHQRLSFANLHLDPRSGGWRLHRSFGAGRAHQTRWLASQLDEGPTVVGGDLNTWVRGTRERALGDLRERFPEATLARCGGTRPLFRKLAALELDHVLVHAPWRSTQRALEEDYGSDHRPLVGRLTLR